MLHNLCICSWEKVQNLREIIWPHPTWLRITRDAVHIMFLAGQALCWTQRQGMCRLQEINVSLKKKIIRRKELVNSAAFLTCLMCRRERKTDSLLWATFQLLQSGIRDVSGELLDSSCPSTTSGWEEGFSSSSEPSQPSDSSFRSSKKKKKNRQIGHKNCCSLGMETGKCSHGAAMWFWVYVGRESSEHSNWKYWQHHRYT